MCLLLFLYMNLAVVHTISIIAYTMMNKNPQFNIRLKLI